MWLINKIDLLPEELIAAEICVVVPSEIKRKEREKKKQVPQLSIFEVDWEWKSRNSVND